MPRIDAFESQRSNFLKYDEFIVFILANNADPNEMPHYVFTVYPNT